MPVNPEIGLVKAPSLGAGKMRFCAKEKQRHLRTAVLQIFDFLTF
jgi:hypothetical protein